MIERLLLAAIILCLPPAVPDDEESLKKLFGFARPDGVEPVHPLTRLPGNQHPYREFRQQPARGQ